MINLLVLIVYKMKNADGVPWMINVLKEMIKDHYTSVVISITINNVMEDNVINIRHVQ